MAEKTKPCPKCGGVLHLRLGELQCELCDYSEPAPKQEDDARRGSFGAPKHWKPPVSAGAEHEPASSVETAATQFMLEFGHVAGDSAAWYSLTRPTADVLVKEKNIYYGITLGLAALLILAVLLADSFLSWLSTITGNLIFMSKYMRTDIRTVAALILNVIGLIILWRVIYGPDIWLKWLSIGFLALGLLGMIIPVFAFLFTSQGYQEITAGFLPQASAIIVLVIAAFIAWYGWLMAILYRDIKQLQA